MTRFFLLAVLALSSCAPNPVTAEVHRLDPRNEDGPRSLEAHRPDFPLTNLQIDGQWSYPDAPGGWATPPVPVPEPSTLALVALGAGALLLKWRVS